jgi:hypothetical protein
MQIVSETLSPTRKVTVTFPGLQGYAIHLPTFVLLGRKILLFDVPHLSAMCAITFSQDSVDKERISEEITMLPVTYVCSL